jgi:hypothetical protein
MLPLITTLAALASSLSGAAPNLDAKTIRYASGGIPTIAVWLVNNDLRTFDSLALRVFVKSKDTVGTHLRQNAQGGLETVPMVFSEYLATRYDICQLQDAAGFNKPCDATGAGWSWGSLAGMAAMIAPLPIGEPDAQGYRDWALDLPLGALALRPGEVVRFDFGLTDRSEYANVLPASKAVLLDTLRRYLPDRQFPSQGDTGWWDVDRAGWKSFDASRSWTFQGTDSAPSASDVETILPGTASNTRLLIRRKGVDLWGTAPGTTGPGVFDPGPSPDVGRPLPYAPIAAPLPMKGNRGPLDSALARPGRVRVNQAGYRLRDVAAGLARVRYFGTASSFQLQREGGSVAAGGSFQTLAFQDGTRLTVCQQLAQSLSQVPSPKCRIDTDTLKTSLPQGDIQEGLLPKTLAEGRWRVVVGSDTSSWFVVSDSVYGWVRDAALRYFGVARSGDSSWFHGPSHMLDGSLDGAPGAYVGGWYDAGDHLKEPQTMASALVSLATMAATQPDRDADRWGAIHRADQPLDGVPDVLKEARWGANFFLNSWIRNGRRTGPDTTSGARGMVTGIGEFGEDHGYWGPPELQDHLTQKGRGGANARTVRRELGANTLGDVAAALALLSFDWRRWDTAWSREALAAAKDIYAYAKTHRVVVPSAAYNGPGTDKVNANLALAATALLRATRDSAYLRDIAYDTLLGTHGTRLLINGVVQSMPSSWEGGWMVMSNSNLWKGGANTDWANRHALALYAFARLVLFDPDTARALGVRSEAERATLLRRTVAGMQRNLASISTGKTKAFDLPALDPNSPSNPVTAEDRWGTLFVQQAWVAPAYVAGNAAELLMYVDVIEALKSGKGGEELAAVNWPVEAATRLALHQTDWILGLNRWDISFLAGVGAKNLQNVHHRAANPDGRYTLISYEYRTPVGGLWGYSPTDSSKIRIAWNDYHHSETTIHGVGHLLTAAHLLAPVASRSTAGIRGSLRSSLPRIHALARRNTLLARGSALGAGQPVRIELFDAAGRRQAMLESKADASGTFALALPNVSRGLAILRVHAAGSSQTISVVVP